jgi:hypothetical protein
MDYDAHPMRRHTLFILIIAALGVSCSKKKDDGKQAKPAESPPVDKGTPGEVADETPPEPNPDKPSSPPAAPAVEVDCEQVFTVDDVAKACGAKAADWEVKKQPMENGKGATTCLRMAGPKVKRVSSLHFTLNTAPGTPDAAKALLEMSGKAEGAKKVEVGDGGYAIVGKPVMDQTSHALEAIKGALWFKVGYDVGKGEKKPICSDQGLVELAKTIAGKLP